MLTALSKEIEEMGESLSFQINVLGIQDSTPELIGQANVDIYIMIEDSCNRLRQVSKHLSRLFVIVTLAAVVQ